MRWSIELNCLKNVFVIIYFGAEWTNKKDKTKWKPDQPKMTFSEAITPKADRGSSRNTRRSVIWAWPRK